MTVLTTTSKMAPQAMNGVATVFSFTFRAIVGVPEAIKATILNTTTDVETALVFSTDYSVDIDDDGVGGSITVVNPQSASYTITLYREYDLTQESNFADYNSFPAETVENDYDKGTMLSQQLNEVLDRTITLPITTTGVDTNLPSPVADNVIGWNATADALINIDPGDFGADAAAASAAAAAASASSASTSASSASASAAAAAASAAGVNLPPILAGDVGKILEVNLAETGYQLVTLSQAVPVDDYTIKNDTGILRVADRLELNIALNAMRVQEVTSVAELNMIDGFSDVYSDETPINTVASTGESYNAGDDFYTEVPAGLATDTKLLVHADEVDGSRRYPDSGNTGHVPTEVTTVFKIANNKVFGTSALWLNGVTQYITAPDSADWNFASGNFTIDFWVRRVNALNTPLVDQFDSASDYWRIFVLPTGQISFEGVNGGSIVAEFYSSVGSVPVGQWVHVEISRNGTGQNLFINGVNDIATLATAFGTNVMPDLTNTVKIGFDNGLFGSFYMDELRISKGLARHTANFSVPIAEYVSDANTQLLLHFNNSTLGNDLIDSGNTVHTITSVGGGGITSKFGSGMAYFNSAHYLAVPDSADWAFGAGDFTLETRHRFDSLTGGDVHTFFSQGDIGLGTVSFMLRHVVTTNLLDFLHSTDGSTFTQTTFSWVPVIGRWYHIAISRNGTDVRAFIDGVQIGITETISDTFFNSSQPLNVGARIESGSPIHLVNGFIDEARVSNSARYTANFTPATTEFVSDANTKLLLRMNTYGVSNSNQQDTFFGSLQVDTAQFKFGTGSLLFNGTTDYLDFQDNDDFNLFKSTATDYTLDFQVRFTNHTGTEALFYFFENGTDFWKLEHVDGSGFRAMLVSGGSTELTIPFGGEVTDSTFHHIALIKVLDEYGIYKDGVQVSYVQDTSVDTFVGATARVGANDSPADFYDGHIDEIRLVKANPFGAAPNVGLTDAFTAPTAAYVIADSTGDMTLISNAETAGASPDNIRVIVIEENVGTPVINTDYKVSVSRDNGTTYTQATLVDEGFIDALLTKRLLSDIVDVTAQPAGTSLIYKIEGTATEASRTYATSMYFD